MAIYDLAFLGGGPAGYVGAIRAAQLGKKVIVIEKERAGGTCLNWGCIPSKSLLKNAEIYQHILHAEEYGISTGKVSFDFAKVMGRSRNVSDRIAKGVEFLLKAKKVDYLVGEGKLGADRKIKVKTADGKSQVIEATNVMLATGCVPRVLPGMKVDGRYKSSMAGVFAAGDIIGPPWLAHVASFEAIEAVNGIFDAKYQPKKVGIFPGCTYCQPQVASIGLTEAAAKEKKLKFKVGRFPYRASGRAVASGDSEGMVKILIGEPHGEILGAHIIGAEATELIAEVGLGMTLEATADEIAHTIHAHPTLTEMIKEATEAAVGHAIHI